MARKPIKKLSDKVEKVNEQFTVNMYDNGFMVEVSGRDSADEWVVAKIMVPTIEELNALVKEVSEMERTN
jgi:hypothetical protein